MELLKCQVGKRGYRKQLEQEDFLREVPQAGPESKQRLKGVGREEGRCSLE